MLLFTNAAFAACTSDQIDVLGDGTQCETNKFSVTTTSDATIVPGKVFRGWKFEKPSGN